MYSPKESTGMRDALDLSPKARFAGIYTPRVENMPATDVEF